MARASRVNSKRGKRRGRGRLAGEAALSKDALTEGVMDSHWGYCATLIDGRPRMGQKQPALSVPGEDIELIELLAVSQHDQRVLALKHGIARRIVDHLPRGSLDGHDEDAMFLV